MGEKIIPKLQLQVPHTIAFRLHALAIDRMTKGPGKRAILYLAFDQVVLCAFLDGFGRQPFVIQTGQHHHHHIRGRCARPAQVFNTMPIGQAHVQQDNVHPSAREINLGFGHTGLVGQFEAAGFFFAEHLAQQTSIAGIVLDQKDAQRPLLDR